MSRSASRLQTSPWAPPWPPTCSPSCSPCSSCRCVEAPCTLASLVVHLSPHAESCAMHSRNGCSCHAHCETSEAPIHMRVLPCAVLLLSFGTTGILQSEPCCLVTWSPCPPHMHVGTMLSSLIVADLLHRKCLRPSCSRCRQWQSRPRRCSSTCRCRPLCCRARLPLWPTACAPPCGPLVQLPSSLHRCTISSGPSGLVQYYDEVKGCML